MDPVRGRRTTCRGGPTPRAARRSPSSPGGPATSRGTSRTRPPRPTPATSRHILEVGHLSVLEHGTVTFYFTGCLALVHPRADPAPALLVLAAVPALRARARRGDGRARRDRRRPGAAQDRSSRRPRPACGPTTSCWRGWSRSSPTSPTPRCAASRPARRPARCCPTRPRPGSWSPATTGRGGTSSRMRATEHADVEIRELAVECLRQLQGVAPQRVRRLHDHHAARRHRGRGQPVRRAS